MRNLVSWSRRIFISVAVTALLCSSSYVAVAAIGGEETANDLFALYNEAQLDDFNEMEAEYLAVQQAYADEAQRVQQSEIYNSMLEGAEKWQQQKLTSLQDEIDKLFQENIEISGSIRDNFYTEWKVLKPLDAEYKMNLSRIQALLDEKSKYALSSRKIVDYAALDELGKEVSDTMTVYQEAADVKVLGVVNGVRIPLGKDTVITSSFGDRVDPMTGTSVRFHAGLDVRASIGTEVQSLFNGVVIETGYGAAGGNYVKVDHGNGIMSYYCHLSEILCEEGQKVRQYEPIALSGNTGSRTTGPHLHIALYINGNPVDPNVLFKK